MAANFYYSSESSDCENSADRSSLDFSYLMLDSDSLAVHLRNSVREQHLIRAVKSVKSSSSVSRRDDGKDKQEGTIALENTGNINTNNEDIFRDENALLIPFAKNDVKQSVGKDKQEGTIALEDAGNINTNNEDIFRDENALLNPFAKNDVKQSVGKNKQDGTIALENTGDEEQRENSQIFTNNERLTSIDDNASLSSNSSSYGDDLTSFQDNNNVKSSEESYNTHEMHSESGERTVTRSYVQGRDGDVYFEGGTENNSYNTEEMLRQLDAEEERKVSRSYVQDGDVYFEGETENNALGSYNREAVRSYEERRVSRRSYAQESDEEVEIEDEYTDEVTRKLLLQHNMLLTLPYEITQFRNLLSLDLSNNNLSHINDFILCLPELRSLYLQNNNLADDGLPKDLTALTKLRELNLSGNKLTSFLPQLCELVQLKYLYLGGNEITEILPEIRELQSLQVLHLGGNLLETVPDELGELHQLGVLILCDNRLRYLPRVISNLTRLRSLLLHKNNLCCLPVCIVKLRGLAEVSLRDNPLVTRFVNSCARNIMYNTPSLLELAARVIKLKKLTYTLEDLPINLHSYLSSGQRCVNPKCKGMYFTSCVEHIKFVDFCGMYRVPLMHYLCSSRCSSKTPDYYRAHSESDSEEDYDQPAARLKRVLLG